MRYLFFVCAWLMAMHTSQAQYTPDENFDKGWRFHKGKAEGADAADFDDQTWRTLDLPHDWAIEGPFDSKYDARTGGLPVFGTGWYRKHFTMPASAEGKVVRVEFEGAMYNAHVWVNGQLVGNRPYGYIGFEFDISEYLNYDGSDNVIAVRLTPEDFSSRWYPGAGIYRSVWLKVDEPVYVDLYGTFISTPTATAAKGVVQHETTIRNTSDAAQTLTVKHEYFSPDGEQVGSNQDEITVEAGGSGWSGTYTNILNPQRWDVYQPNLYKAVTTISSGETVLDTYHSTFGIRSISYDAEGFYVNDKQVKFNGVCLHHDNGALGAAVYKRADERKLEIMVNMGVNAIRTSHNPPSREFLELCDEMGLLVLDESFDVWKIAKVENGYNKYFEEWWQQDVKDMVLRDRNHPSVIMWSLGNEIKEQWQQDLGWKMAKELHAFCKSVDPSRPTTIGFNSYPTAYDRNMAQQVDIAGANYKAVKYSELKKNYPELPLYGSETASCYSTRGVYHFPIEDYKEHESLQTTSYDFVAPPWGFAPDIEFHFLKENPTVMGEFVWTGFDYLGETSPYGGLDNMDTLGHWNDDWPARSSYFGIVDLAGFPKDRFYLYQSQWTTEPMIHLLPHWNLDDERVGGIRAKGGVKIGDIVPVYCYTNCEEAELFVNGKSMGRKVKGQDPSTILVDILRYEPKTFETPYRLSWEVPYEPGSIKVVGYKNGQPIQEKEIKTAGKPAQIKLSVDRRTIDADGRDLAYVTVQIVDKQGNFCPLADNLVKFEVSGAGRIAGVDNGNPTSLESFQGSQREAFNGLALVILNSTEEAGTIRLVAKSKKLKGAEVEITTTRESLQ
ncbi:glycoside hydrolase family 2 TIM barrel-domain containing protein [Pontibacter sp. G13]|uniref:glycoside hydrolase family 2 TIM barrel-domain containing protein n=1 Tax=Pontibacter sp. G13 TaxID=3074898 RepID=UPI00288A98AD|nr:glycoside hydrolase family 2 TIM barrel-domain containing protein [Pontibacter sp. G13]WNJ19089.1 glycoside hydrolase family 2 TIM barrel-domain containing protein [Pontibacter sp. G13]